MNILIKIFFSTIEFSAMILLCLSLFRIHFRYSLHKVFLIALILSSISVYIRDIILEPDFSALPVIIAEIVLITLFFSLPLIFSLLMCVIGSLATATMEGIVISLGAPYNLFTQESMQASAIEFMCFDLIVTALLLLLVYPLLRYKLGFHTTSNDALKGYNFLLSAILVIAIVIIQVLVIAFKQSTLHFYIPIISGIVFLIGIYLAYKHNKKLWENRRARLAKR
jgi:hypothetical protein